MTQDKRVRLVVDFRMSFYEITLETAHEMHPRCPPEELRQDPEMMSAVERQSRLLHALLEDEEALRGFIACAVIAEVSVGQGELLRKALNAMSEAEVLKPVTEGLGGEVAAYYEMARGEDYEFNEEIDMVMFSTPVECVGVRMEVRDEREGESDKEYLM